MNSYTPDPSLDPRPGPYTWDEVRTLVKSRGFSPRIKLLDDKVIICKFDNSAHPRVFARVNSRKAEDILAYYEKTKWELLYCLEDRETLERLIVPGGWIYRNSLPASSSITFVPDQTRSANE